MNLGDPDIDARVQAMLDRDELYQLACRYCRAVDRHDYETLRSLYHADAVDAHGGFSGGGVEQFIARLIATERYVRTSQHNVTTTNFAVQGDSAEGEIYCLAFHTFADEGRDVDVIIGGRYLDKYSRRARQWRISQRTIVTDWVRVTDPSEVTFDHPSTRGTLVAEPGELDPSCTWLTLLGSQGGAG